MSYLGQKLFLEMAFVRRQSKKHSQKSTTAIARPVQISTEQNPVFIKQCRIAYY